MNDGATVIEIQSPRSTPHVHVFLKNINDIVNEQGIPSSENLRTTAVIEIQSRRSTPHVHVLLKNINDQILESTRVMVGKQVNPWKSQGSNEGNAIFREIFREMYTMVLKYGPPSLWVTMTVKPEDD